jgi:putative transposase
MTAPATHERSTPHRLPGDIISRGVWLSYRFTLRYRDVQERLCARGLIVSHDAIRTWGRKCGQGDAKQLRHRCPRPGDQGHSDEGLLTMHGKRHYLWRAVDQDATGRARRVQSRRHQQAGKKVFRTLLKGCQDLPRVISPAQLKSYGAAKRESLPRVAPRQRRYRNDRGEHCHRPTRQREYHMQGCKSPGHAPRFLSAAGPMAPHCRPRRHLWSASAYRQAMRKRCARWAEITGTKRAAEGRGRGRIDAPCVR